MFVFLSFFPLANNCFFVPRDSPRALVSRVVICCSEKETLPVREGAPTKNGLKSIMKSPTLISKPRWFELVNKVFISSHRLV